MLSRCCQILSQFSTSFPTTSGFHSNRLPQTSKKSENKLVGLVYKAATWKVISCPIIISNRDPWRKTVADHQQGYIALMVVTLPYCNLVIIHKVHLHSVANLILKTEYFQCQSPLTPHYPFHSKIISMYCRLILYVGQLCMLDNGSAHYLYISYSQWSEWCKSVPVHYFVGPRL